MISFLYTLNVLFSGFPRTFTKNWSWKTEELKEQRRCEQTYRVSVCTGHLRVDELAPPVAGQGVVHQHRHPPAVLAQTDLGGRRALSQVHGVLQGVLAYCPQERRRGGEEEHLVGPLLAGLLGDEHPPHQLLPLRLQSRGQNCGETYEFEIDK